MLENLVILMFDLVLFTIYTFIGLGIALLIQLISYRVFKFNLYKCIKYYLFDRELSK